MNCPRCNVPADEATLREFGGVCPKCLLQFAEEQDAPAFPNLEIVEMIGQGGMGVVYKARQRNLDRLVALKVLSPQLSDDPEFVERFTREAKALAQLNHPNIVGIHDSGIHDHVPYLVMEYVDGTALRKLLALNKLPPERVLEIIPQICDALNFAHAHGVIHRDIKPENILIDRSGRVKIADFGLAKLASIEETRITRTGYVMGSPHYMAPEQIEHSGKVDHRADIYSLGVVFYEMLTGNLPIGRFKPPSAGGTADRRLDPVVLKSLEREPEDRWQTADEVKARLARLDDPLVADDRTPGRFRKALIFGAAALVFLLALLIASTRSEEKASTGGAVAVTITIVVLGVAAGRRRRGPVEPRGSTPSFNVLVAIGTAAAVLLAIIGLFLVRPRPVEPPAMAQPVPAPETPRSVSPQQRFFRMYGSGGPFELKDAWPDRKHLPDGVTFTSQSEGEEAAAKSPIPKEAWGDLTLVRRATLADGHVELVGYQFKSEFTRRRWEKERAFADALNEWKIVKGAEDSGVMLLRHDGSPVGAAAAEVLMDVLQRRAEEAAQARKR